MEFGVVGFDGSSSSLMGSNNEFNSVDFEKQKYYGSGFLKQERSGVIDHDDLRALKSAKKSDDSSSTELLLQNKCGPLKSSSSNSSVFCSDSQNMLSFASPKADTFLGRSNGSGFMENNSNSRSLENAVAASALPYFQHQSAAPYGKNAGLLGYCSGGLNGMYYMDGVKGGLFTPSQWLELEHQALIFKYITANETIPPHLLLPIRKALESAGFSAFSAGHFRPNATWGWSPFHLAFSNNSDPEPGRCRRTDGKKWRCSRDAMPDQKYCERHMNRGRHRSRKPVEGQTNNGHPPPPTSAGAATTTAASNTNNNKMNHQHLFSATTSCSNPSQVAAAAAPGASNSFNVVNERSNNLGSANASPTTSPFINRLLVNKQNSPSPGMQNDSARVSSTYLVSPSTNINNLNSGEISSLVMNSQLPISEQHHPDNQFGVPSSDFLLSKCSSFSSNNYYLSSTHVLSHQKPKPQQSPQQNSLCSFKDQSSGLWPELDPDQSDRDRTQLSISIPMAPSDYMSSTSSPINNEKTSSSVSPLRLSREQHTDSIQMGLGVGLSEPSQKTAANWIPITSMGGPLGEVLNNSSSFSGEYCNNSSALNLLSKDHCYSSPTGVLHKAALRSLSNSSAGSSPGAENSKSTGLDGSSLCTDLLGSSSATLVQHNSLSALQHC